MSSPAWPISGCVLVGGRSSRFGSNKAFAVVDGETLVEHALNRLRRLGADPYLVAKDAGPYRGLGVRVVDTEGPQCGPVAGWKAGLEEAEHPWVLVLSVDMPYVTTALLSALIPEAQPASPGAHCYPRSDGGRHPFPGLYHRDLARHAEGLGPAPSMHALLDLFGADLKLHALPENSDRALININRPADFH